MPSIRQKGFLNSIFVLKGAPITAQQFNGTLSMSRIVMKFGGTSVADLDRIRHVAALVAKEAEAGHEVAVVVSAMSGETNRLVGYVDALGADIADGSNTAKGGAIDDEYDAIVSSGEQVTSGLLAIALRRRGIDARSWLGWQIPLKTDKAHAKARIADIETDAMNPSLASGRVAVVAGFQGVNDDGRISTLGRGGSDTSAVALAVALKADRCDIYTDVDGIYTTDPRIVPEARRLKTVTFEEMLEMASLGSKVLQLRSVEFAGKYKVKLRVLSSFKDDGEGTLITYEEDENMEQPVISGIAFNRDEAKITVSGVPDHPGIAYQILGPVADANVDVDMIIQNVGHDGLTDFSFTVHRRDFSGTMEILKNKIQPHVGARDVIGGDRIAKVSVVGVGMRSHAGIASKMFRVLAEEGINIQMIATSEIKVSVVVDEKYMELAVRVLHKAFDLEQVVQS